MLADKPSRTAQHNALFRAIEARKSANARVADDQLAVHFLPPEFRLLAEAARVPVVRRLIETVIDRRWPGPRAGMVVRTAFIDERVRHALPDIEQVLVLGAGFDTRPYRLEGMEAIHVFEVDHPSTQSAKERVVRRILGDAPSHVTFVPVEFGRDDLMRALSTASFTTSARTLVLWEGVTNYLTADAVDQTFRCLTSLVATGSPIVFTYIDRGILDGSLEFEGAAESGTAVRKVGEPYTFGFDPAEVGCYLADRCIELLADTAVSEVAGRYYPRSRRPKAYAYYHVVEARRS